MRFVQSFTVVEQLLFSYLQTTFNNFLWILMLLQLHYVTFSDYKAGKYGGLLGLPFWRMGGIPSR
jgi:hypothetical protein